MESKPNSKKERNFNVWVHLLAPMGLTLLFLGDPTGETWGSSRATTDGVDGRRPSAPGTKGFAFGLSIPSRAASASV